MSKCLICEKDLVGIGISVAIGRDDLRASICGTCFDQRQSSGLIASNIPSYGSGLLDLTSMNDDTRLGPAERALIDVVCPSDSEDECRGQYDYEAMNAAGQEVSGTLRADSSEDAIVKIRRQGLFPSRIKTQGDDAGDKKAAKVFTAFVAKVCGPKPGILSQAGRFMKSFFTNKDSKAL